jgi:hypothetical protein
VRIQNGTARIWLCVSPALFVTLTGTFTQSKVVYMRLKRGFARIDRATCEIRSHFLKKTPMKLEFPRSQRDALH